MQFPDALDTASNSQDYPPSPGHVLYNLVDRSISPDIEETFDSMMMESIDDVDMIQNETLLPGPVLCNVFNTENESESGSFEWEDFDKELLGDFDDSLKPRIN